jgi:hypothetical protein
MERTLKHGENGLAFILKQKNETLLLIESSWKQSSRGYLSSYENCLFLIPLNYSSTVLMVSQHSHYGPLIAPDE